MQLASLSIPHTIFAEPIVSSGTGTISAITRNNRLIEQIRFEGASELNTLWRYLWATHGLPVGHPDRPYITIKRDNR